MTQKVHAGNLSYNTTEGTLRTLFAEYGEIISVNLITDRDTGRPRFVVVRAAFFRSRHRSAGAFGMHRNAPECIGMHRNARDSSRKERHAILSR